MVVPKLLLYGSPNALVAIFGVGVLSRLVFTGWELVIMRVFENELLFLYLSLYYELYMGPYSIKNCAGLVRSDLAGDEFLDAIKLLLRGRFVRILLVSHSVPIVDGQSM